MISEKDIIVFSRPSTKKDNDIENKLREDIIYAIINNKIHKEYYINENWKLLKINLNEYLNDTLGKKFLQNKEYDTIKCEMKAGRKFNYDFNIIFYKDKEIIKTLPVEFKFNSKNIFDIPQFYSPTKPSEYFDYSYEKFYYKNYFYKLVKYIKDNKLIDNYYTPSEEEYIKKINNTSPDFCKDLKALYKNNPNFKKIANKCAKDSIQKFISKNEINTTKLLDKIISTQSNKHYMLYYNNQFYYDSIDCKNIKILDTIKTKNSFKIYTNIFNINVLLRWKNNNGIAFHAFQISKIKDKR